MTDASDRVGWRTLPFPRQNGDQELSPSGLRGCAARCRSFADRQPDPRRAELFRDLAVSFERYASIKERRDF